jgi:hypothetical protein
VHERGEDLVAGAQQRHGALRTFADDRWFTGFVDVAAVAEPVGQLQRIDTRTGKIAGTPIRIAPASSANIGSAYAIAPAGSVVWATSPSADTISRIQATP